MSGYTGIVDATVNFVTGTFDAQDVRLGAHGNALPGLYARGDFTVSQRAAGANMSVDISSGRVFVEPGGPASQQGIYMARTEATYNTSSDGGYTWTAADGSNPRIDLLCIEVADADEGGSFTGFKFRVVDGTPSASATHQLNVAQWPAIPNYVVPIAAIKIPAADTTISTADITNLNPVGGVGRANYIHNASNETTTSTSFARLATPDFCMVYVPHTGAGLRIFHEANWKASGGAGDGGATFVLNGTTLKVRNLTNGAPAAGELSGVALSTSFYSRLITFPSTGSASATSQFLGSTAGATADVSDVTTGVAGYLFASLAVPYPVEVSQLAAGWYLIEAQYKISANTLNVKDRRMRVEVIA